MARSKTEIDRRVQAFIQTCRRQGLKVTHQRTEIFRELAVSQTHPDAEAVFQAVAGRVPSISRDTVYRTLSTLEAEGLIRKVEPVFESVRYDANLDRHHHFICMACGAIHDFYSEDLDSLPIPSAVKTFGRIDSAQVQVRGICSACVHRKDDLRDERSERYE